MRQDEKVHDRHRAGRRLGTVVVLFHPQEHGAILARCAEPPAVGHVPEERVLPVLELNRPLDPRRVPVCLKELQQPEDQVGVVVGIAVDLGLTTPEAPEQRLALFSPQAMADERRRTLRSAQIWRGVMPNNLPRVPRAPRAPPAPRDAGHSGKRAHHQPIPGRQDLIVEVGSGSGEPNLKETHPRRLKGRHHVFGWTSHLCRNLFDRLRHVEQVLADELLLRVLRGIPVGLDAETQLDQRGLATEELAHLVRTPEVERPFRFVR